MSDMLTSTASILIVGGIGGFFVGYIAKKLLRFAITIGVVVFALMYMTYRDAININLEELAGTLWGFVELLEPLQLTALMTSGPFIGSFGLGLLFGLRQG